MKKALSLVLALVMMMSLVTIGANAAAGVAIAGAAGANSTTMGNNLQLTATPTDLGDGAVTYEWTSSDTGVATVSGSAATTALVPVKPGTTNITVKATYGSDQTVTSSGFAVTVKPYANITQTGTDGYVGIGETITLSANANPSTDTTYAWTVSGDSSYFTADTTTNAATFKLTGAAAGSVTAQVVVTSNSQTTTLTKEIKVLPKAPTVAASTATTYNEIKAQTSGQKTLTVGTVTSNNTSAGLAYQWYSNTSRSTTGGTKLTTNAAEATYTPSLAAAGTTYYYCVVTDKLNSQESLPAYSSIFTYTVNEPYKIAVTPATSRVTVGGYQPLTATYQKCTLDTNHTTATYSTDTTKTGTLNWSNNNNTYLKFGTNSNATTTYASTITSGVTSVYVYGASRQISDITVTATDSTYSGTSKVTVQDSITTTASAMNLSVNETGYAAITVTDSAYASYYSIPYYYTTSPSNTYYYRLTGATSSNSTVATAAINATGLLITGKAAGTATITYAVDVYYGATVVGKQTGSFTVTVGGTDIEYYTTYGTNVTFDEIDFQDFFAKATGYTSTYYKPSLSYVQFTNLTNYNTTYNGSLYTKNVGGTVMATNTYAYNNASGNQVDLDAVTFFPGSYTSTSYTVRIPFTAYGYTYSGTTLSNQLTSRSGYVTIKVNATDVNLAMTLNNTTATTLASINSSLVSAIAAKKNINAANVTVNSVTFGAQQDNFGTLYANSSRVALGTSAYLYNVNGTAVNTNAYSNYFHNLYFVPTATTTGGYYQVPFTASTNQGAVTGLLTIKVPATGKTFLDVPTTHTFYKYIQYVADKGIMNGSGSYFNPGKSLTRAQLVVTLYRLAGSPTTYNYQTLNFKDANQIATTEFANAIRWAVANDIIGGYADNTFRPNSAITRQAMVTILYRYAEATNGGTYYSGNQIAGFKDASRVAKNMTAAMNWAVYNGYITGNGSYLNPTGTTTRGAAAKILAIFNGYTA